MTYYVDYYPSLYNFLFQLFGKKIKLLLVKQDKIEDDANGTMHQARSEKRNASAGFVTPVT